MTCIHPAPPARGAPAWGPLRRAAARVAAAALALGAAFAYVPAASAQDLTLPPFPDAEELDVDAALQRLLAANPDVARARLQVERARLALDLALAPFDGVVGADLGGSRARQPTDEGFSSGTSVAERIELGLDASRTFTPGTRLSWAFDLSRTRSEFPVSSDFFDDTIVRGPNWGASSTLSATQPLLRGRGRAVGLLPHVIAQAELDASDARALAAASVALGGLLNEIAELTFAWQELDVRRRAVERAMAHVEATRALAEAGRVALADVDLARARVAATLEAELAARAAVGVRSDAVRRYWSARDTALLRPVGTLPPGVDPAAPGACDLAREASPEVRAAREVLSAARARTRATTDQRLAQLDVSAGVTQSGLDANLATSLGQMAAFRATTLFATIRWTAPVRNRRADAEHAQALVDAEVAALDLASAEDAACANLDTLARQAAVSADRFALATARVELARAAVEAEAARYAAGWSTVQAGLDAQQQLEDAELDRARIERDQIVTGLQAAAAVGALNAWLAPVEP